MKKIAILSWWTWSEVEIAKKSAKFIKNNIKIDFDYYELPNGLDKFIKNKNNYDLVIPVFHWVYWEDWKIFALLNIFWLKHSFSSYESHSICLDKFKTNILVESLRIKVPKQLIIHRTTLDASKEYNNKRKKW